MNIKSYQNKVVYLSINKLRNKISKNEGIRVDNIPSSKPSLMEHIKRVKWQINEWSHSRSENINSVDPIEYDWTK